MLVAQGRSDDLLLAAGRRGGLLLCVPVPLRRRSDGLLLAAGRRGGLLLISLREGDDLLVTTGAVGEVLASLV